MALHAQIEDMLNIGAYQSGASAEYDLAAECIGPIREFLRQDIAERCEFDETVAALERLSRRKLEVAGRSPAKLAGRATKVVA